MTSVEEVTAPSELPQEELEALVEATQRAHAEHPVFRLLDPENATWHQLDGPGLHVMTLMGIHGVFDVPNATFTADDPELVRAIVVEQLGALVGDTPVVGGARPRSVDWTTLQLGGEADGVLSATATTIADPDDNDAVHQLDLAIDLELQPSVLAEELISGGPGPDSEGSADGTDGAAADHGGSAAPAAGSSGGFVGGGGIAGPYLGAYYGDTEFPFDGKGFVIDWTTWATDQTTDEGLVGSPVEATSDGASYQLYVWFDPKVGIQIVRATGTGSGDAPDEAAPSHGITAAYLGDYYGDSPLPFDGRGFVVDWTTWDPDQVTDEGMVGSRATATDDGRAHDVYVWFDRAHGARIAEATATGDTDEAAAAGAAAAGADTAVGADADKTDKTDDTDPRAHFDDVLTQQLRERWAGNGNKLVDSGKEYDVSAWVNGEYGGELEFVSHDGAVYFATVTAGIDGAGTTDADGDGDEPRQVRCHLRIQDADSVTVESEETLL